MKWFKLQFVALISIFLTLLPFMAGATSDLSSYNKYLETKFPRLANLFFRWDIQQSEIAELARYDVLVLDMENQIYSPDALRAVREKNPNIKILAYITSEEIRRDALDLSGTLRQKLARQISDGWYLKDNSGNKLSHWPGTWLLNITDGAIQADGKRWNDILPEFVNKEIMSTGLWDGVFYDNIWKNIAWVSPYIDINNDHSVDTGDYNDARWQEGVMKILTRTRELLGPDKLIVANSNTSIYNDKLNGRLFESFPNDQEGGWVGELAKYRAKDLGFDPNLKILNVNTKNLNTPFDYRTFRYGLASALLGEGFYSFDKGDQSHAEIWWYDEYEVPLGKPAGVIKNILKNSQNLGPGLWQRDFQNGFVLLNNTNDVQTINFDTEYERLKGTQDVIINNGAIAKSVSINPEDAIILLRPVKQITGSVFTNASFVRAFTGDGQIFRNGFFAYDKDFRGSANIVKIDLNHDGLVETIVGESNRVEIYNEQNDLLAKFFPYGEKYNQGINIALGDIAGDGQLEIATAPVYGAAEIKIFDATGNQIGKSFFAYDKKQKYGATIALGDTNADGKAEIITGPGYKGGSEVRIFDSTGKQLRKFLAYDKNFRGGANVAIGDLYGNGKNEIVTGAGLGGGPQVKIFDTTGKVINKGFFAFNSTRRTGVKVIVNDLEGDGKAEIIAAQTNVFTTALTQ